MVQPPPTDWEMVDMFLGTLIGPFFNLLIGSSSSGFTEMILIGERIESGIKSGKIPMVASSIAVKKPFRCGKEVSVFYGLKSRSKISLHETVRAILISNPTPAQQQ